MGWAWPTERVFLPDHAVFDRPTVPSKADTIWTHHAIRKSLLNAKLAIRDSELIILTTVVSAEHLLSASSGPDIS